MPSRTRRASPSPALRSRGSSKVAESKSRRARPACPHPWLSSNGDVRSALWGAVPPPRCGDGSPYDLTRRPRASDNNEFNPLRRPCTLPSFCRRGQNRFATYGDYLIWRAVNLRNGLPWLPKVRLLCTRDRRCSTTISASTLPRLLSRHAATRFFLQSARPCRFLRLAAIRSPPHSPRTSFSPLRALPEAKCRR